MLVGDLHDFPCAEFQRRLDGLRTLMAERDIDAALITTEANHRYFTGHVTHRWSHHYVAIFALLPLEGEPMLVVQPNEACMCKTDSWIETIRIFPAVHDLQGVAALADAVREAGLAAARIGTELGGRTAISQRCGKGCRKWSSSMPRLCAGHCARANRMPKWSAFVGP